MSGVQQVMKLMAKWSERVMEATGGKPGGKINFREAAGNEAKGKMKQKSSGGNGGQIRGKSNFREAMGSRRITNLNTLR